MLDSDRKYKGETFDQSFHFGRTASGGFSHSVGECPQRYLFVHQLRDLRSTTLDLNSTVMDGGISIRRPSSSVSMCSSVFTDWNVPNPGIATESPWAQKSPKASTMAFTSASMTSTLWPLSIESCVSSDLVSVILLFL